MLQGFKHQKINPKVNCHVMQYHLCVRIKLYNVTYSGKNL